MDAGRSCRHLTTAVLIAAGLVGGFLMVRASAHRGEGTYDARLVVPIDLRKPTTLPGEAIMSDHEWADFMNRWSRQFLASPHADRLTAETRTKAYLGAPAATEQQIADAERRLGIALPPSYKAFLRYSNGWGPTGHAIERLWPVQKVDWFATLEPDWVKAYSRPSPYGPMEDPPADEYFAYGQYGNHFKDDHLKHCLQITPEGDSAVYLLNPQVISADGEWEAWFFANWVPGAQRYRSFQELMIAEYHGFAGLKWQQPKGVVGSLPREYIDGPEVASRKAMTPATVRRPSTDDLLSALNDPALAMQFYTKAAQPTKLAEMSFGARGGDFARREVIEELARRTDRRIAPALRALLQTEQNRIVRKSIVAALGDLRDEASVDLLLASLDKGPNEAIVAMASLQTLAPQRLSERLMTMIGHPDLFTFPGACSRLAELRELRAIPILKRIASSPPQDERDAFPVYAAQGLSAFGEEGCMALLELCQHANPQVRRLAISHLTDCMDRRVEAALKAGTADPDKDVREVADAALKLLKPSQRSQQD